MNKAYLFAPLAGLVVFSGVYWNHRRDYDAKIAETKRVEALAKQARAEEEVASRSKAQQLALETMAQRKQERAERERDEEARKQTRVDAEQRRALAIEHERKLRVRLDRLRTEMDATRVSLRRLEERSRELRHEDRFLTEVVPQIEANRAAAYQLLEKLESIERSSAPQPETKPAPPSRNG